MTLYTVGNMAQYHRKPHETIDPVAADIRNIESAAAGLMDYLHTTAAHSHNEAMRVKKAIDAAMIQLQAVADEAMFIAEPDNRRRG